jgi:hypothetical protein
VLECARTDAAVLLDEAGGEPRRDPILAPAFAAAGDLFPDMAEAAVDAG